MTKFFDRIRSAIRALFVRNPTVTIEVANGAWSAKWTRMTADDAAALMACAHDAVVQAQFSQMHCSETVH